jgi:hypothetical protein
MYIVKYVKILFTPVKDEQILQFIIPIWFKPIYLRLIRNKYLLLISITFNSASGNVPVLMSYEKTGLGTIRAQTHVPWVKGQTPYPLGHRTYISYFKLFFVQNSVCMIMNRPVGSTGQIAKITMHK